MYMPLKLVISICDGPFACLGYAPQFGRADTETRSLPLRCRVADIAANSDRCERTLCSLNEAAADGFPPTPSILPACDSAGLLSRRKSWSMSTISRPGLNHPMHREHEMKLVSVVVHNF